MGRPPLDNVEATQSFLCSYCLKEGLSRAAKLKAASGASSFVRILLENECRKTLGKKAWAQLNRASRREDRQQIMNEFLGKGSKPEKLRDLLYAGATKSQSPAELRSAFISGLQQYIDSFRAVRKQTGDLGLAVALREAEDIFRFVLDMLKRKTAWTASRLKRVKNLIGRLPVVLQSELDAVIAVMATQNT